MSDEDEFNMKQEKADISTLAVALGNVINESNMVMRTALSSLGLVAANMLAQLPEDARMPLTEAFAATVRNYVEDIGETINAAIEKDETVLTTPLDKDLLH